MEYRMEDWRCEYWMEDLRYGTDVILDGGLEVWDG